MDLPCSLAEHGHPARNYARRGCILPISSGETTITTIMVFVMVALASIFFFAADQIIRYLITFLLGIH